jgi:altronate dehydratase
MTRNEVVFTPEAEEQLAELYRYIEENATAAVALSYTSSVYGLACVPVVKVATRSELARRWHDLMDINAGTIADASASMEEVGWELFRCLLDVASGTRRTCAERLGLHNALTLFNPAPVT